MIDPITQHHNLLTVEAGTAGTAQNIPSTYINRGHCQYLN